MPRRWLQLVTAFALAACHVDVVPPRSLTAGRMFVTKRRIIQFAQQRGRLPQTFADLPAMPGYDTETVDAWGRPFDYSVDGTGIVTLRSLGADKQPGGDGDNRDMIAVFATRDAEGHWQNELGPWIQDPLKPGT